MMATIDRPCAYNTDQVSGTLEKRLAPAWLIVGDEALLTGEAADAVRARARAEGSTGREFFVTDRNFDWSAVSTASRSLSLFAERSIIEIRMPAPRPGKEGGEVLAALAADPGPDNLLLVVTTRPEKDTWSSAWFKAFEKHVIGLQLPHEFLSTARLNDWYRASEDGRLITEWRRSLAAGYGDEFLNDADPDGQHITK